MNADDVMQQNRRDNFNHQRPSSSLLLPPPPPPPPLPPPQVSTFSRLHHEDGRSRGNVSLRRGNLHARPRGAFFHGPPTRPSYGDPGTAINHDAFGSGRDDSDLRGDIPFSETNYENLTLQNPSQKSQFPETYNAGYGNLFSRNPTSELRLPNSNLLPAQTSDSEMISIGNRNSFKPFDVNHPEERNKPHLNIALQQAVSSDMTSRSFYAAEVERSVDEPSEFKPDLKDLLNRFDELGGLETVLKARLGEQHLSQSLRDAMESHGSTTELSTRRNIDYDLVSGYTSSKQLIKDRLDQGIQSSKKFAVDDRLNYRSDNFEPRTRWVGTEPSIRHFQEDNMLVTGGRGESLESRSYGVGRSAFEDDAFHGAYTQAPTSNMRTRSLIPEEGVRKQENLDVYSVGRNTISNLPERPRCTFTIDGGDNNFAYADFQPSKLYTNQVQGAHDDSSRQPTEFPLCERATDHELSLDSEPAYTNLGLKNMERAPISISEELSLFVDEENKNSLLREADDSLSGKIDVSFHFESQKKENATHHDFNRQELSRCRSEFVGEDGFVGQSFDSNTESQNRVNLTLRSRLSASPDSNVNLGTCPVGDYTDELNHLLTTSGERIHKSKSNRSSGRSQYPSRSSSATVRDRLDKSIHCLDKSRRPKDMAPACEGRKIYASSNSSSLVRDAGQVSVTTMHDVKGKKERSYSLSRGISARLQSTSPFKKNRSPLGLGNRSLRGYNESPRKDGGSPVALSNRSRPLHHKSPVLSSNRSPKGSRCKSSNHEGGPSISRLQVESAKRLHNESTDRSSKGSAGRLYRKPTERLRSKSVERLRKPTASVNEKSSELLRKKSTEHSRSRSKILRDRSPRHLEFNFHQRSGAMSPMLRSRDRALAHRSLSPQFSRTAFNRSLRIEASNSPIERRLSPSFDELGHRFETRNTLIQLREPIHSLNRRYLNSPLEPVHFSRAKSFSRSSKLSPQRSSVRLSPQLTVLELFPKSPLQLSPPWSPARQSGRLSGASQLPQRSPKPCHKNSADRRSPMRSSRTSLRKSRRSPSPITTVRVSPLRMSAFHSQRSPRRHSNSQLTHTIIRESSTKMPVSRSKKDNSRQSPRKSPRSHPRVISRLSPRKRSSNLSPPINSTKISRLGSSSAKKAIRSNKSPFTNEKPTWSRNLSCTRQPEGSPRRNPYDRRDRTANVISQHSLERTLSPQSSRKRAVFDRLASKDSKSPPARNIQLNKGLSTSMSRSSKFSVTEKGKNAKIPVKDRLGERKIEAVLNKVELKVIDEVSIDTVSDSRNQGEEQDIRLEKEAVTSGTKRSAPTKNQLSATEPPKKKNFVPIVFSATDFEEKPSSTWSPISDSKRRRVSPRADVDGRGKQNSREDTDSRRLKISESLRDSSRICGKYSSNGARSSARMDVSASFTSSRHVASSSSRTPKKNKDVKEMNLAELRKEIAKYDGDRRAAGATSSREELRLLLLQAKEEQVEKKLRSLNESTKR